MCAHEILLPKCVTNGKFLLKEKFPFDLLVCIYVASDGPGNGSYLMFLCLCFLDRLFYLSFEMHTYNILEDI